MSIFTYLSHVSAFTFTSVFNDCDIPLFVCLASAVEEFSEQSRNRVVEPLAISGTVIPEFNSSFRKNHESLLKHPTYTTSVKYFLGYGGNQVELY